MCVESVTGQIGAFARGRRPALSCCPEAVSIGGSSSPGVLGCEQPTRLASSYGEDTRHASLCQPTRAGLQPLSVIGRTHSSAPAPALHTGAPDACAWGRCML